MRTREFFHPVHEHWPIATGELLVVSDIFVDLAYKRCLQQKKLEWFTRSVLHSLLLAVRKFTRYSTKSLFFTGPSSCIVFEMLANLFEKMSAKL